jgi:predicted nucleic acid-binding Zn ribbon protein
MANIKASKTGKYNYHNSSSLVSRERRRVKTMQIVFAIFCIVLILSMVLSLVTNS